MSLNSSITRLGSYPYSDIDLTVLANLGISSVGMYAITDLDNDWQEDLIIPTLNKKKIAILSIFGNNDAIYVDENLELMDKLTSNIIVMDINYDGYTSATSS